MTGRFSSIASNCPPVHLSAYITQELPDLPLSEETAIIRPAYLFRMPQKAAQYAFVVGYSVRATANHLVGTNISMYQ